MGEAARDAVGAENLDEAKPGMGAEDFSYFALERPSCFFNVGTGSADKDSEWPHHHPRFDVDEDGMAAGIATMATAVVTGAVAQVLQANPKLSPAQVKFAIQYSAEHLEGFGLIEQGAGSLDVPLAVGLAQAKDLSRRPPVSRSAGR